MEMSRMQQEISTLRGDEQLLDDMEEQEKNWEDAEEEEESGE